MEKEVELLKRYIELEDLAEKKAKIYSHLFIDPALAGKMEKLSLEHEERKLRLEKLLYGEEVKVKSIANEGGRVATNGKEGQK